MKTELWEGGHRVPLFIKWEKGNFKEVGKEVEGLCKVTDILPTLVELCGLKITNESSLKGISLASTLHGNEEISKTGTLFASSFLTKLKNSVLNEKYPTTMRIKLYRGGDWAEQLAQPLEVKVISIEKIERTNWKFIVVEKNMKPILEMFLPSEIIEKL